MAKAPIAAEAVRRIDELFAIERDINGQPAEERLAVARGAGRAAGAELEAWLRVQLERVSRKSETGKAIAYALNRWHAHPVHRGRADLPEQQRRRAGAARRGRRPQNWTFAGSDRGGERAAAIYTLIETAKLNGVDPQAWLADVLARLPDIPPSGSTDLLPWNWKAARDISSA